MASPLPPGGNPPSLLSLGTAAPEPGFSQAKIQDFVLSSFALGPGARDLYKRALGHPSIQTRGLALDGLDEVLDQDHDHKNDRFRRAATALSALSLRRALAGRPPESIDFLVVTTCTGYLCPGLSSFVAEAAGLRADVRAADLVGMGCGAAIPALRLASDFCRANPGALAAVVATEICSAAFFPGDAPDLVVSNAIFADGSAAAILGAGAGLRLVDFESWHRPDWREELRFKSQGGHLRNVLGREVPARAAEATGRVMERLFSRREWPVETVDAWVLHPGGSKVIDALEDALPAPAGALASARAVLRRHGNVSSPAILFVLQEELSQRPLASGGRVFMAAFGAGFSAHAALLEQS